MGFFKWYWEKLKESSAKTQNLMARKCPRCDSTDIETVKQGALKDFGRMSLGVMLPITLLFNRPNKPLRVCRKCGFSWEDR